MLINFCDSAFTIGQSSSEPNIRYLKQIKQRNTELRYGADNVILCELKKPYNFLHFIFVGFGRESDHLKQYTDKDKEAIKERVKELRNEGKSYRDIGGELGISHMKAKRLDTTP